MIFSSSDRASKISKRPVPEDREEGEAPDGDHPSPPLVKDPLKNVQNRTRSNRTATAYHRGYATGVEFGRRESADIIEQQNRQIGELNDRIKRLTEQLALEAAHLSLANQRTDLCAIQISTLSEESNKHQEEKTRLKEQLTLLAGQLDQTTAENNRLRTQATELAKLKPHSSYLNIQIPRKKNQEDGSV